MAAEAGWSLFPCIASVMMPRLPRTAADISRRELLAVAGGAALAGSAPARAASTKSPPRVRYCLNTSTLMECRSPRTDERLTLPEIVTIASEAGYTAIEPWIREIERYAQAGGSLPDLAKRIADAGLTVESAIGFASWIVDDETQRNRGLEQFRRDMDLVRQIGGTRIAAPPVGAHQQEAAAIDLLAVAERYGRALEIGAEIGVTPQVEIWGPSRNLFRLGQAVFAAVESGHPRACVLPDIYHIFRGGSGFDGLKLLSAAGVQVFHVNDYPGGRARETLTDADRVYPGDGAAPIAQIVALLQASGFCGALSLELFNREYWSQDPQQVAQTGIEKMRAAFGALE